MELDWDYMTISGLCVTRVVRLYVVYVTKQNNDDR